MEGGEGREEGRRKVEELEGGGQGDRDVWREVGRNWWGVGREASGEGLLAASGASRQAAAEVSSPPQQPVEPQSQDCLLWCLPWGLCSWAPMWTPS